MFAFFAPAAAQGINPGTLPPQEILGIVQDGGFDPLGQPVRRGPNYVLRAVDDSDREVSVVINARTGGIVSVTPVTTASRVPPGGSIGPYERITPGYVPPGPPGYRGAPTVIYEDDEPVYARPPAPGAPLPRGATARSTSRNAPTPGYGMRTQAPADVEDDDAPDSRPLRSTEIPPPAEKQDGLLPPPPERFPQRAAPAAPAKPKPVKRAAATPPKSAPLPKPRPADMEKTAPSSPDETAPPADSINKSDPAAVPH
jgi:hypothetical protein